ncbi:MAG TPA: TIGR02281 family clan AA aspartic protease [Stellaceae bacterium]|nr:TIGR02281 family clan AA aspartic protease [Stellaceae bacterium]
MRKVSPDSGDMDRMPMRDGEAARQARRAGRTLKLAFVAVGVTVVATLVMSAGVISRLPSTGTAHAGATSSLFYHATSERSIPASADGQIHTEAKINDRHIHFRVDQAETQLLLTLNDARAAGLTKSALDYSQRVKTSAGEAPAAPVLIPYMQFGTLTLFNVKAVVVDASLPESILGTEFLGRFQSFEMLPGKMVLRW